MWVPAMLPYNASTDRRRQAAREAMVAKYRRRDQPESRRQEPVRPIHRNAEAAQIQHPAARQPRYKGDETDEPAAASSRYWTRRNDPGNPRHAAMPPTRATPRTRAPAYSSPSGRESIVQCEGSHANFDAAQKAVRSALNASTSPSWRAKPMVPWTCLYPAITGTNGSDASTTDDTISTQSRRVRTEPRHPAADQHGKKDQVVAGRQPVEEPADAEQEQALPARRSRN